MGMGISFGREAGAQQDGRDGRERHEVPFDGTPYFSPDWYQSWLM
jgi:hypothetical protein